MERKMANLALNKQLSSPDLTGAEDAQLHMDFLILGSCLRACQNNKKENKKSISGYNDKKLK